MTGVIGAVIGREVSRLPLLVLNRKEGIMLLQIFYYLPAILGVLFIAVGTYHGWKFRGMTRRCKVAAVGTLLGFEEKKMKSGTLYYPVVRFRRKTARPIRPVTPLAMPNGTIRPVTNWICAITRRIPRKSISITYRVSGSSMPVPFSSSSAALSLSLRITSFYK